MRKYAYLFLIIIILLGAFIVSKMNKRQKVLSQYISQTSYYDPSNEQLPLLIENVQFGLGPKSDFTAINLIKVRALDAITLIKAQKDPGVPVVFLNNQFLVKIKISGVKSKKGETYIFTIDKIEFDKSFPPKQKIFQSKPKS